MTRITTTRSRLRKFALAALVGLVLSSSSGCALLVLGAAGTGGYLIRKGEEGGNPSKKEKAEAGKESSPNKTQ